MMRERLLAALGAALGKLLFATIRLEVRDRSGFLAEPPPFPVIVTFWHNRILAITIAFQRRYPHARRKGVVVLTSPSRDGEILARVMAAFRMGSVRGSSSRRGSRAVMELVDKVRGGYDLAVTPDGPRGPRYRLGPGLVLVAQLSGARVLPVHAKFSRAFVFKTWDEFRVPLPFSKVTVTMDPYVAIPATPGETEFETQRQRIEDILNHEPD